MASAEIRELANFEMEQPGALYEKRCGVIGRFGLMELLGLLQFGGRDGKGSWAASASSAGAKAFCLEFHFGSW